MPSINKKMRSGVLVEIKGGRLYRLARDKHEQNIDVDEAIAKVRPQALFDASVLLLTVNSEIFANSVKHIFATLKIRDKNSSKQQGDFAIS